MTVNNEDSGKMADLLRRLRKKSGLSRKELADLAGVGKTTVFDLEGGKLSVRFDNILKVLRVLNVQLILQSPLGDDQDPEGTDEKG